MDTVNTKTVIQVTVEFSSEEFALLAGRVSREDSPRYIHDLVVRSLKRKKKA